MKKHFNPLMAAAIAALSISNLALVVSVVSPSETYDARVLRNYPGTEAPKFYKGAPTTEGNTADSIRKTSLQSDSYTQKPVVKGADEHTQRAPKAFDPAIYNDPRTQIQPAR